MMHQKCSEYITTFSIQFDFNANKYVHPLLLIHEKGKNGEFGSEY